MSKDMQVKIPRSLREPAFLVIWREWTAERRERGKRITTRAAELQLAKLAKHPPKIACAMIQQSIENGWTGIFECRGMSPVEQVYSDNRKKHHDVVMKRLMDLFGATYPRLASREEEAVSRFLNQLRDYYHSLPGESIAGSIQEGKVKYLISSAGFLLTEYIDFVNAMFDKKPKSMKAINMKSKLWQWFIDHEEEKLGIDFTTGERTA